MDLFVFLPWTFLDSGVWTFGLAQRSGLWTMPGARSASVGKGSEKRKAREARVSRPKEKLG